MHIIGTAGHVDHGKSSLVTALTGHNPDRLIEEQRRGMTLDLGFAPLQFPDGIEAGIIDVPGHERFLHNMLAGAAGMELLLLVVAANDGPKRQTFEHLHILNFLNVSSVIIVLTKIDLVDDEARAIAAQLARDASLGTVAEGAPLFEVSSETGTGVAELKAAIHDTLAGLPPRRIDAPVFLPVDRVFALAGHGTVITGTLMQGTVKTADTLAIQPSGLVARVKSLQVFGKSVQRAEAGSRLAVNVPGIEPAQIGRGDALVSAREFRPTRILNVEFSPLDAARSMLRKRMPVRVHIGSAEILGNLRFENDVPDAQRPARASIVLSEPTVHYPGMRLILRRVSPKDLLGGATALAEGEHRDNRAQIPTVPPRRDDVDAELADAPPSTSEVLRVIRASQISPLNVDAVAARANVTVAAAQAAVAWLVEHGQAVCLEKPVEFLSSEASVEARDWVKRVLNEAHERAPWRVGLRISEIAKALSLPEQLSSRLLALWHEDGQLESRAGAWSLPGFTASLTKGQNAFFDQALAINGSSPYAPLSHKELAASASANSPQTLEALDSLLAVGALVRIGEDIYRRSQIEKAQAAIRTLLESQRQATMAQMRDVLGTSRKHALPLMEYFDSIGLTTRDGDLRRLRRG